MPLPGRPGAETSAPLCVNDMGFGLHAATHAGALDARARETLVKYVLRPPLAQDRVERRPDGLVRIHLKRAFRDGTAAVDMEPAALLARLCTSVPPPRLHTVRYAGVLAPAAKLRPLVVPPPTERSPPLRPPTHRCGHRPWAELLKLTFKVDVLACPKCPGRMRLLALVRDPSSVARFLTPLGEPLEPPPLAPARGPPFFRPTATPDRRLVDVPGLRHHILDFDHPA